MEIVQELPWCPGQNTHKDKSSNGRKNQGLQLMDVSYMMQFIGGMALEYPQIDTMTHHWTKDEDALLVESLVELRMEGEFLDERGFKPGFLRKLEEMLVAKALGSGLKAIPHILSRLKTLRSSWQTVYDMKNKACGRNKSFPHFEPLTIAFVKDLATDKDAQSVIDILHQIATNGEAPEESVMPTTQEIEMPDFEALVSEAPINNFSDATSSSRRRRRRSGGDVFASDLRDMIEGLGQDLRAASASICATIEKLAHEADMVSRKEKLYQELVKVEGLTNMEVVRAHLVIGRDNSLLVQFPTVPDDVKVAWIRAVLE